MSMERVTIGASRKAKEGQRMPDSEAKKRWMKENTTVIRVKLNHNTDAEIVEYIKSVDSVAGIIKKALREYMENHKEET